MRRRRKPIPDLAEVGDSAYFDGMSMAKIREQIAGLTVEERLDLAALIGRLNRTDDAEYQSTLDRRAADMDAGKKTPLAELERQHRSLTADGQ
jgi:hypothetical protein